MRVFWVMLFAVGFVGCRTIRSPQPMPFPHYAAATQIADSITSVWERGYNTAGQVDGSDVENKAIIRRIYVCTYHVDFTAISATADLFDSSHADATEITYDLEMQIATNINDETITSYLVYAGPWQKEQVSTVFNGDGTARQTVTLRKTGDWTIDPFADDE